MTITRYAVHAMVMTTDIKSSDMTNLIFDQEYDHNFMRSLHKRQETKINIMISTLATKIQVPYLNLNSPV